MVNFTSKTLHVCRKKCTTAGYVLPRILGFSPPACYHLSSWRRCWSVIFLYVDHAPDSSSPAALGGAAPRPQSGPACRSLLVSSRCHARLLKAPGFAHVSPSRSARDHQMPQVFTRSSHTRGMP